MGVAKIVNKFEKKDIPISVFMLDKWQTNNSYEFNDLYKDPKSIVDFLWCLSKQM